MQRIKSMFAKRYNKAVGRCGPFWNERFGCKIVEDPLYVTVYIGFNPIKKGKVVDPREVKYGSYRCYFEEKYKHKLKITLHKSFLALGKTFKEQSKCLKQIEDRYREKLLYEGII